MSKSCRKTGRRVKRERSQQFADVTLNDFANSNVAGSCYRFKKNSGSQTVTVKQLSSAEDDRAWDEKLDDLELMLPVEEEEDLSAVKKPIRKRRQTAVAQDDINSRQGESYHIDVWFLISEYIHPESVGKFARICKTSYAVTQSAKFWFDLYKRYYRNVPNLPERLQPECIIRRYGLKAYVIRALYFLYQPFVNSLIPQTSFEGDPHGLTKRQCVLSWCQKNKNQWFFFFKLKSCDTSTIIGHKSSTNKPDLLEMLEDINVNMDYGCKVLQVACLNYTPLPMVLGQKLSQVSVTLSQGLRYHRMQLGFGCSPISSMVSSSVVLDPVTNVRVLDWWHPSFPHSNDGLRPENCSKHVATSYEELDF